ncbi:30S ribosomal protein S6 [Spiroplasma platyhelix]|uniref:Small ribosomal subunit protein bS6 n=1 Tax=Spiroplasma platyhelix PALS-1 TaxID=1276218 RepID=A0A846U133_9MOLU|nr:30S ribosomal protein S6 [Spiroplasma platyhelix]MBE4704155.1 30S ribosomal protein S6 [Spiroplasma platyhelix PALS-1]NKE38526.1 30S ribosomal protein S6 [Spiroplasma platyhelix PALS-1]UJB29413.1 30S ribosomal protein S6 [Spiroplasma platyhelix PALS-1]
MQETKFNNYEIMYIVDDQNPEKANLIKKEFVEILTKNNGKITKEEDFIRQFAYKINHKNSGHYFILQLSTTPENIADFNRIFSIKQKQGDVVRKLVINLDEEKINTFKERKESPKKPEFTREYNREPRVKTLDTPKAEVKQELAKTNKEVTEVKQETQENSSEKSTKKENTEEK